MKRSEIYREAAAMVFAGEACALPDCGFTCCALSKIARIDDENREYSSVHLPFLELYSDAEWWNEPATPQRQEQRVLALCFMAALTEWEEDHAAKQ